MIFHYFFEIAVEPTLHHCEDILALLLAGFLYNCLETVAGLQGLSDVRVLFGVHLELHMEGGT